MGAQRSPNPKLDLRGPHCSREGREEGDGVREEEEREVGAMKEGTGAKGKRWALADFGGKGPLRCQTLFCCYVYPNSTERHNVVF